MRGRALGEMAEVSESMKLLKKRAVLLGIAMGAVPAFGNAQVLEYFDDRAAFQTAATLAGRAMYGIETFEESNLAPNSVDAINDPLEWGVANLGGTTGQGYASGLTGLDILRIQSNGGGHDSATEQPQGEGGLAIQSATIWQGPTSDVVTANILTNATDIIFTEGETVIGGRLLNFSQHPGATTLRLDLYDLGNNFLESVEAEADMAGTNFWGVISDTRIGRINVYIMSGVEGMDDIEVWRAGSVPEPASMIVLGAGAAAFLARRRRK
jgi:hypothetical protein